MGRLHAISQRGNQERKSRNKKEGRYGYMGLGPKPPPLGWELIPWFIERAPNKAQQFAYGRFDCTMQAWLNFLYTDPNGAAWWAEVKRIRAEREREINEWLDDMERKTGQRPDSWFANAPLFSDESLAAWRLGIDEPIWPCPPKGYVYYANSKEATISSPRDPLILDLDHDGIETVRLGSGVFFDHSGDGFAEQSGWVASDDGFLVMDRNGDGIINDGKEMFGNETILSNGKKAANGFEALAELDSNHDGRINEADAGFSHLKVLKGFSQDGYQIYTLDELGIQSIDLDSTVVGLADSEGNTQVRTGSFHCEWGQA